MRAITVSIIALAAACAHAPTPPLHTVTLASGSYDSTGLRLRGHADAALIGWRVDVDCAAGRIVVTDPDGRATSAALTATEAAQPYGCPSARQETFAIAGVLVIAGTRFAAPIVLADCGARSVTIFDRDLTRDDAGPLVVFDRR